MLAATGFVRPGVNPRFGCVGDLYARCLRVIVCALATVRVARHPLTFMDTVALFAARRFRADCFVTWQILFSSIALVVTSARAADSEVIPRAPQAAEGVASSISGATPARPALAAQQKKARLAELRAALARHDVLYHQKATPEISDAAYDKLKRELRALEAKEPELAAVGVASAEIGDDRTGLFPTHRHRLPMLSLDKAYTQGELNAFHARLVKRLGQPSLAYVVEPKIDGLAISVTYEHGTLVRAVTRGNGFEGDDITVNARLIRGLPRQLNLTSPAGPAPRPWPERIELRGEIYVTFAEFERINADRETAGEPLFAHPRSLAAGTVRQRVATEVMRRNLDIVFYGIGACEPAAMRPPTQHDLHEWFRSWGVPGLKSYQRARDAEGLWSTIEAVKRARSQFPFPTDGVVIKVDDVRWQNELGESESAPRWAIAYKFPPERTETELLAITVQVGRTGVLTPVAELAPVTLAGTTVARATLHNRDEILRKDIRVGDFVYVEKAGEIIPAITGVNLARRTEVTIPYTFPKHCPACMSPTIEDALASAVRCANEACPAQLRRRLEHFASKAGVAITGLGPAMIEALVAAERVHDIPDLYHLKVEDVIAAGVKGEKSAERLLTAIERSRQAELWRFIHGLGLPQVGAARARELAGKYGSLAALLDAVDQTRAAPGGENPGSTTPFFVTGQNRRVLAGLLAIGVSPAAPASSEADLAGKIFVFTGTLPTLSRSQATQKIERAGGKVTNAVTRRTDFLVAGSDTGAKLAEARILGVAVIDEGALLRMLDGK